MTVIVARKAPSAPIDCAGFELLAKAIAGHSVEVKAGFDLTTWTNGEAIFLGAAGRRQLISALIVQTALISAGSLSPRILSGLLGRPKLAARYLAIEASRLMLLQGHRVPRHVQQGVLNCIGVPPSTGPHESLAIAKGSVHITERPDLLGIIRPNKIALLSGFEFTSPLKNQRFVDRAAEEKTDLEQADDREETEESKILKLLSVPGFGDNPLSRLIRDILNLKRQSSRIKGEGGAELPTARGRFSPNIGRNGRAALKPSAMSAHAFEATAQSKTYPEWDWKKNAYKAAWTTVAERDPDTTSVQAAPLEPLDGALLRQLVKMGGAPQTHRRRRDGDSLDLRAMVDVAVSKASGQSIDERVYQARLNTARELGVLVLLDASGSTAEAAGASTLIWEEQKKVAGDLIGGLEKVGDRVAAYAFRSVGRHDVRFLRLKEFDGRYDHSARARLLALKPAGFTRLGAAIRHARWKIRVSAGTRRRLLVLISDGVPYEDGYEGRYAREDVRQALAEAGRDGIGCVCLSVGSSVEERELKAMWGETAYLSIVNAKALVPHVETLFKTALRLALGRSHRGTADARRAAISFR